MGENIRTGIRLEQRLLRGDRNPRRGTEGIIYPALLKRFCAKRHTGIVHAARNDIYLRREAELVRRFLRDLADHIRGSDNLGKYLFRQPHRGDKPG